MQWRVGEILLQRKWIGWDDLEAALEEQEHTREFLGEILIRKGKIPEHLFFRALADQFHLRYVDLNRVHLDEELIRKYPPELLHRQQAVPVTVISDSLMIAVCDPMKSLPEPVLLEYSGAKRLRRVISSPAGLRSVLDILVSGAHPERSAT